MIEKQKRGFALLDPERRREISRRGGQAAQAAGTAHRWTEDEASEQSGRAVLARQAKRDAA